MSYQVSWGRDVGSATISTIAELDAVLDTIGPVEEDIAYSVGITALDVAHTATIPPLLEIGIGHPHRSFVYHVGADGTSAWGFQPGLAATPEVYADYGGVVSEVWPERARVTPATARQAAREFLTNGVQRPACLRWEPEEQ
jgi:hypothetical protein